tara:strand:+ start:31 stop:2421 length:2391 start_codon:yes stop_codon:yes gene_type:complete
MALFDPIRLGAAGAGGDYEIERSLRFNSGDSANMHREGGSDGNRRTFTVSVWIKRTTLAEHSWWDFYTNDANRTIFQIYFGQLRIFSRVSNSTQMSLQTDSGMKLRDFSAWYHFLYAVDTTQSTSTNRVKIYINGEQQTLNGSYPSQNAETYVGSNNENRIGCQHDSAGNEAFLNGYMAELNYIDGSQLTPSDFAETDTVTGEYKPIEYSGSYGSKGYYINFSDNSSVSALGTDFSGNGNNFTSVNGFSVSSGVGNDSVTDTPTNNWATMSPSIRAGSNSPTYTNGNLSVQGPGSGIGKCGATFGLSSGKWYAEAKITHSGSNLMLGIINAGTNYDNNEYLGSGSDFAIAADCLNQRIRKEGSNNQTGLGGMQNGDILAFAIDMDNGTFQLYNNGSTKGSSVSFTVANYAPFTFAQTTGADTSKVEWNFGQQGFTYTPPAGYVALNSQNLPAPTATPGSQYVNTVTYTANRTARSITGVGFQPDWVWIKSRDAGQDHAKFDAVRGVHKSLKSNSNFQEQNFSNTLTSFDSDGFSLGNDLNVGNVNYAQVSHVAWNWFAGGSTVTNTNGNISSQVRASATAGISIVGYSGNGSNGQTVGHGLGVAPDAIILKCRTANQNWRVWHRSLATDGSKRLILDQTNSSENAGFLNDTAPTSTVFTLGNSDEAWNESGDTYIAYVFSGVEGFSKFGSYTGNGNSDGAFVFTGFRPAWIMVKRSSDTEDWAVWDSHRDSGFNPNGFLLRPNSTSSEGGNVGAHQIDILSNGFKFRNSDSKGNGSGSVYVYFAFAELPFKFARAR